MYVNREHVSPKVRHTVSRYYKRGYCIVEERFIEGHVRRRCKKCHALYMREWRKEHCYIKKEK